MKTSSQLQMKRHFKMRQAANPTINRLDDGYVRAKQSLRLYVRNRDNNKLVVKKGETSKRYKKSWDITAALS